MNHEELAWAAGFFDGEGSIGVYHFELYGRYRGTGHMGRALRLSIQQADRYVLDRFVQAVGIGRVMGPYRSGGKDGYTRRPRWKYDVGSFETVQAVVAMIWRWLSPVKRVQAGDALREYRVRVGRE